LLSQSGPQIICLLKQYVLRVVASNQPEYAHCQKQQAADGERKFSGDAGALNCSRGFYIGRIIILLLRVLQSYYS
jgi:hypothetical protein